MAQDKTGKQPPHRRGELEKLARAEGITPLQLVQNSIRKTGSIYGAAKLLKVSPNSVRYHLKKAKLAVRITVVIEFVPLQKPDEGSNDD